MTNEPSNAELGRDIAEVKDLVQKLVGQREYEENRRHVDHRLVEHDHDIDGLRHEITAERTAREDAIKGERTARENALTELRAARASASANAKNAFYGFVGTVAAGIVLAALAAWVTSKGGH